jgi:Glycosyltransferase Family 4
VRSRQRDTPFASAAHLGNSSTMTGKGFPRLLYLGDVPVEHTQGGMALLYRMLQDYPADRLLILQSEQWSTPGAQRLSDVPYRTLWLPPERPLRTRFAKPYSTLIFTGAPLLERLARKVANSFEPEAILTVAHGFSWIAAAALADSLHVPLHLIVHDDPLTKSALPRLMRRRAELRFETIYRGATTRLCVSPYMETLFRDRYGLEGSVILPLRAADAPQYMEPPAGVESGHGHQMRFVYAGSLHTGGPLDALVSLGRVLVSTGGRVEILTPTPESQLLGGRVLGSNVSLRPLVPASQLVAYLRDEADVLVLAMEFSADERSNMEINFPTKLTDYTAAGLPLLIWGPPYGSAVRWARENPGVAEVVDRPGEEALRPAVERLVSDPAYRRELGKRALQAGQCFSHSVVTNQFHTLLNAAERKVESIAR